MTEVVEFIYRHEGDQRTVMLYFHALLTNEMNHIARMRFKIPFYFRKSWICYLNPTKKGTVEFALVRGNELSNEQGLLESKGRKQVLGIEFGSVSDISQSSRVCGQEEAKAVLGQNWIKQITPVEFEYLMKIDLTNATA